MSLKPPKRSMLGSSILAVIISLMVVAGCSDDSPVTSSNGVLTVGATLVDGSVLASGRSDGSSALAASSVQITSASIVISRFRVKSVGEDTLDFNWTVPQILDLSLNGEVQSLGSISLPPGDYDETRFRIDGLDSLAGSLYDANPDMQDISIKIEGYVNDSVDSTFVWSTALDEEQVFEFITPFSVVAGGRSSLVIELDYSQWFDDGQGGSYDPRDEQNQSEIENNIKNTIDMEERDFVSQ